MTRGMPQDCLKNRKISGNQQLGRHLRRCGGTRLTAMSPSSRFEKLGFIMPLRRLFIVAASLGLAGLGLAGCVSTQGGGSQAAGPQECNPMNQNTAYGVNTVWPMAVSSAGCNGALDVGGTILSSSIVQQPKNGSATINMDEYTYTPKPGFTGKDSFVIKVTASGGAFKGTSLVTFDITVSP